MTTTRISENGWDLNTLTTHKVNQEAENPQILQMKQELQKMNQRMTEREQRLERKERLAGIKNFLTENSEEFEFTLLHDYGEKVLELQNHFYENEKKILSDREAAKAIEAELEKYEQEKAGRLATSKKGKEFYKGLTTKPTPEAKLSTPKEVHTASTLQSQNQPHQEHPSEPPQKPKSIFPPVAKKPLLKLQVANPLTKEVDGSFKHPNRGKSKSEVLQRIVAAFGQNS